ncbi:MAG: diguanylate cyclase [Alcanivoracaceae bacterium]|nr:diguanylate cyclase [Alcanivoracaceae bacterium]
MLFNGTQKELAASLNTIGASFAIFEKIQDNTGLVLVSANSLFEEITLKPLSQSIGITVNELLPRYVAKSVSNCANKCISTQSPQETELIIEREGKSSWWRFVASPIIGNKKGYQRIIVTLIDITEKKLLEQELKKARQRYEAVVETAYDGIITIDKDHMIKLLNESARDIFRIGDENVIGTHLSQFLPQRFRNTHKRYVNSFKDSPVDARAMQSRTSVYGLRKDGTEFPIEVTISKIRVGTNVEMTAVIRDISEKSRLINELSKAATFDSLTGLINRRHGLEFIERNVNQCNRLNHTCSIVMLDIDHFKAINDNYGHFAGDQVLLNFCNTLKNSLREIDMVCRWGGEEFVVMLSETSTEDAKKWAERTRLKIANQITELESGQSVSVTVSSGISSLNEGQSTNELISLADKALYHSKNNGRNRVSTYDQIKEKD